MAIGDREQGHFWSVKELLNEDLRGRSRQAGSRMFECRVAIVSHDNTLAGGKTVVFDDVRCTELVQGRGNFVDRRAYVCHRGGDIGGGHEFFCVRFAALELRRRRSWAKACDACVSNRIGHTIDQWALRSDDDEGRLELDREGSDRVVVEHVHVVDLIGADVSTNTGISGGSKHSVNEIIALHRAHKRVLTCARADDQNLHERGA